MERGEQRDDPPPFCHDLFVITLVYLLHIGSRPQGRIGVTTQTEGYMRVKTPRAEHT